MKQICVIGILAAVMLTGFNACVERSNGLTTVVRTENGEIRGTMNSDSNVFIYRGIPFAAPPVGELRWKAPRPHKNWEGILECTEFEASAMQSTPVPFMMWTDEFIAPPEPLSEDCLYLNIWTAAGSPDGKLPVLVFIHGGAFTGGSGSVEIYDGEEMAKKGVVFITVNYRLGVIGFLAHPELSAESPNHVSGNYGLLDQVEALKWIQRNIASFGGDPDNVTIAGQSAGAFSVNFLVASPLAGGLFHRAIAESGGAVMPANAMGGSNNLEDAEKAGLEFQERAGAASLAELRSKPAQELIAIRGMSSPVIDGYLLPDKLYNIFSEGRQNDVPVLMGWNENEAFFGGSLLDAENYRKRSMETYGEHADRFMELFPADNDSVAFLSQRTLSILQSFGLQSYIWMKLQNETGKSRVFMYHFTRSVPYGEGQQAFGAFHTGEVPYAYNNLHMSNRPWTDTDYELADRMSSYWANFTGNGDPNGEGLPLWPACETPGCQTMYLGENIEAAEIPFREALEFLEMLQQLKNE